MGDFHWYPGHMAKAKRAIEEDLKLIDVIIELTDARAPLSSGNPDIAAMANGKGRMIVMSKSDLSEEKGNESWMAYFKGKGLDTACVDLKSGAGMKKVRDLLAKAAERKHERDKKRGIRLQRPVRALVCGIPNVGKSTFINSMAGKNIAKTGNRPGVTKGKQWIAVSKGIELLDSPGLLWPKIGDERAAFNLALLGSMNDEVIDRERLTAGLIDIMKDRYPKALSDLYGVSGTDDTAAVLEKAAGSLNMIKKGGQPDTERAGQFLLDSFRCGKLGRITLELPG
ncbi:MAG: ribosome biogenesis GTPase YlqF [Lachnospiraceae bacterium]|nr:ribosome biogenesis GTPase YlqF [Lachnospiraceae bacterium]